MVGTGCPEVDRPTTTRLAVHGGHRDEQEVACWHLAEIFCAVPLGPKQAERVAGVLLGYLEDRSKIVRYCAVQALGVVGARSGRRPEILAAIESREGEGKSMAKVVAAARERLA